MSADLLRKAATILRERAEGAITGDGPTRSTSWFADSMSYSVTSRFEVIAECEGSILAQGLTEGHAEWFALMDPGVGLALADWLEFIVGYSHDMPSGFRDSFLHQPLVIARLIVGEQP